MSTTKLIALMLLLSAGVFAGGAIAASYRRRAAQLSGVIELIAEIELRIRCENRPLSEIFADFESKQLPETFLILLKTHGFAEALGSLDSLESGELAVLRAFAKRLGGCRRVEQLSGCDATLSQLRPMLEQLKRELPAKSRVAGTLCTALGAAAALLLI